MMITVLVWIAGFMAGGIIATVIMALIAAGRLEDKELEIWRD